MNSREDTAGAPPTRPAPDVAAHEEPTGLPFPGSWPGVYLLVFGCFVVCVALLAILTAIFS